MSDITVLDTTDPQELAGELDKFSTNYAKRTGDYERASMMMAAAAWLRELDECVAKVESDNARLERYAGLQKLAAKPRPVDKSMDEQTIERIYWERFVYTELPAILVTMEIGTGPDEFFRMVREEWQEWRANEYDEARNSGPGIRGELV